VSGLSIVTTRKTTAFLISGTARFNQFTNK
jgi:hypothetical protein